MLQQIKKSPVTDSAIRLGCEWGRYRLMIQSDWTLQFVLHDKLGFTGTKALCSEGACGACTVIVNGRPILSCMTLAIECDGKSIETIEGIARANHPLLKLM